MKMEGKSIVVTGGASGIGKSIVDRFLQEGAWVSVLDLNIRGAKKSLNPSEEMQKVDFYSCDVSKPEQVGSTINKISDTRGLDVLVNNAGIGHVGKIEDTDEKVFDALFQVNVKGVFNCSKFAVSRMKWRSDIEYSFHRLISCCRRSLCLLYDERSCSHHDPIHSQGLPRRWDTLQLYCSRSGAHTLC